MLAKQVSFLTASVYTCVCVCVCLPVQKLKNYQSEIDVIG